MIKSYLTLIVIVLSTSAIKAQDKKDLDPKFIYEKLIDIYHRAPTMDPEDYFSQFGFATVSDKNLPDGNVKHRAVNDYGISFFVTTITNDEIINGKGGKEFNFTTHSLSNKLFTTIESGYSTNSRKEYKNLLSYITSIGYKPAPGQSPKAETQVYQMDKLQIVFQKVSHEQRPYQISYSIKPN